MMKELVGADLVPNSDICKALEKVQRGVDRRAFREILVCWGTRQQPDYEYLWGRGWSAGGRKLLLRFLHLAVLAAEWGILQSGQVVFLFMFGCGISITKGFNTSGGVQLSWSCFVSRKQAACSKKSFEKNQKNGLTEALSLL
ncbi:hypothetical protein IFM89_011103 [Coptis chinensis]|uniref:Uncharacterized protein n=1 Tax=Coptis chinensis TaxID=261450 RepID=A0A835IRK5_9MAGN|nr:hypothetical protein IFM89_011103 [Coptis chinensis]